MRKLYFTRTALAHLLGRSVLALGLLGGTALAAEAQTLNYTTGTASNVAGTFTDLGTTGKVIATANTDDANSAAQDIGFTFSYNGTDFTQFVLNTNGLLRLGSAPPSATTMYGAFEDKQPDGVDPVGSTEAADVNLLMPFNFDLQSGSGTGGAEYRVVTTGTAPNQVCTIQWKNVSDKSAATPSQYANFTFQVKLYQTTNVIEFVYDRATASTNTPTVRFPSVGIKGSGSAAGQDVLVNKAASASSWANSVFITGKYGTSTHNIRANVGPDPGRTYRFVPALPHDAAVSAVYTLGKLPATFAQPHTVQAVISNRGTMALTNVPVTLNVTGANTFTDTKTLASLAVGASATVTFAAYPATLALGANLVTVSVPNDDVNANNSASYGQQITANRFSYVDTLATTVAEGAGLSYGTFLMKYTMKQAAAVSSASIGFAAQTGSTAPYQVVVYDATGANGTPGKQLYATAVRDRTAAAGIVTVPLPNVAVPATFYVGVRQTSTNFLGLAYQIESPIRSGAYYITFDQGASWLDYANGVSPLSRFIISADVLTPNCVAPSNIAVSNPTINTATVSFTPAAAGVTSYEVVYGPTGFDPATQGTKVTTATSPVTLTGLAAATYYQVYVRSNCTAGGTSSFAPAVTFATLCDATVSVPAAPYSLDFDMVLPSQSLPCGVTVLDANNDKATWAITHTTPASGTNAMRYTSALTNSQAADDWFFTPALTTTAGTRYQVAFRYRGEGIANAPSSYVEKLEVKAGPKATAADQKTLLYTNTNITNTSYALANASSAPAVAVWQPGAGTQYVGFHAISDATQGNLYIDDLSISVVLGTSEVLMRAITVFPNPSTDGLFDLDIHGAKAKGVLDVQVVNALGQVVYTGTARDNATNRLDLSNLANGLYHLQVRNGDDTMSRQISVVR